MIAFIPYAVKWIEGNWKLVVGALLAAPAIYLLGQCSGQRIERQAQAVAREKANSAALAVDAKAKDNASADRVVEAIKNAEMQKELYHEISKVSDSVPGAARIALGCRRLLNAGKAEADLPAVCRPAGGH